jgi:hypothetical protein
MSDVSAASERLAASRGRLLLSLQAPPVQTAAGAGTGQAGAAPSKLQSPIAAAWRSIPGALIFSDAVAAWWAQHPAHKASAVAASAAKEVLAPVAQKHPLALVSVAMVLGGVFVWSRPWRWALKPALESALFAGLVGQLWSKTLPHLTRVPLQAWLAALGAGVTQPGTKAGAQRPPQSPP